MITGYVVAAVIGIGGGIVGAEKNLGILLTMAITGAIGGSVAILCQFVGLP